MPLLTEKVTRFGNALPMDPLPFPKNREELNIAPDAVVFTLVARGIPEKGWAESIRAFVRLRKKHPQMKVHLLLCGEGPTVAHSAELHIADPDITFLGFQSRICGLYRLSDCAIVPTRFGGESFPLCIIQALQTGTPVIATRIGEIDQMLAANGAEAGILIENQKNNDHFVESLENAMEQMLSAQTRKRYADVAKELGPAYNVEKLVTEYAAIYDKLIQVSQQSGSHVLEPMTRLALFEPGLVPSLLS